MLVHIDSGINVGHTSLFHIHKPELYDPTHFTGFALLILLKLRMIRMRLTFQTGTYILFHPLFFQLQISVKFSRQRGN